MQSFPEKYWKHNIGGSGKISERYCIIGGKIEGEKLIWGELMANFKSKGEKLMCKRQNNKVDKIGIFENM